MSDNNTALADVRAINAQMREKINEQAAALTAAHERETALREELALTKQALTAESCRADVWKGSADTGRAALAEAQRERLTGELAIWQVKVDGLREVMRDSLACDAHSVYLSTWREVERHMDALGLTAQPPQDAEPAT